MNYLPIYLKRLHGGHQSCADEQPTDVKVQRIIEALSMLLELLCDTLLDVYGSTLNSVES